MKVGFLILGATTALSPRPLFVQLTLSFADNTCLLQFLLALSVDLVGIAFKLVFRGNVVDSLTKLSRLSKDESIKGKRPIDHASFGLAESLVKEGHGKIDCRSQRANET